MTVRSRSNDCRADPDAVSRLLSALSSEYNRHVLQYFRESGRTVTSLSELADYVTDRQADDTDGTRVAIRLHHVALPAFADAEVVEYDARSGTVRLQDLPAVEKRLSHVAQSSGTG